MNRRNVWVVTLASLLLVAALPVAADDVEGELTLVLEKWEDALNSGDIDEFMECYWADAVRIFYFPGSRQMEEGARAIRAAQSDIFSERSEPASFNYDPPVTFVPDGGTPSCVFANSAVGYMEIFEFERRVGEYRIIKQYVLPHPPAE